MFFKHPRTGFIIVTLLGLTACSSTKVERNDYGAIDTTDAVIRYTTDVILQEIDNGNVEGVSIALVDANK
ncbi:hypothetical protein ACFFLZ_05255 [Photobacterium aphoticum]|uniref:Uncharacterized protein n=1 Tax=Photobacterium aphoticum TaxID=754436 RepID=A0A0J1GQX9_9GAMM|nr:hypothetical protein [Photobacterium aphoticum]KLV01814.1 hypothetical protein ABT58_05165 [Photobacterium aphoticum]PSU58697.1 hypothetical protein C9I90_05595 [Photobacterium aphoticum]GHA32672.1 hypothetical protein GCM10007086_02330 [Photobacterium aphoticum]